MAIAIRFGLPGLRIEVNSPILPILTQKLVAIPTSSEPAENRGSNRTSTIKLYLPYGESLVKIGPVGPEIV